MEKFDTRAPLKTMKDHLQEILRAAIRAADPYGAVLRHLLRVGNMLHAGGMSFDLNRFKGIVVVKYGHSTAALSKIIQIEASHPLPDEAGVKGTERIAWLLRGADEATFVICLL